MIRIILAMMVLVALLGVVGEDDRKSAEAVAAITAREQAEIINAGYGRRVVEVKYVGLYSKAQAVSTAP